MSGATVKCPECGLEYSGGELFCPVDGARLPQPEVAAEPADPLIGLTLNDRYKIHRRLGEGGMGIVYEAEHVVIEKRVALKVLRDDFSSRPDVVERFRQEAKSASRIGHEHIVDISDFGETPSGASYFVMEMLRGRDLAEDLEEGGPLTVHRALAIAMQCCRALGAAHAKGIVHRDMKPENIFMCERESGEDFVKIVDFGIAKMSDIETDGEPGRKLTKTGMIFGTPEYMSPEQAQGKSLDHRVDVYAMGVILYELLTGRVPFVGDTFMGILTQHMFEQPPPLQAANPSSQVPPNVEAIIFRALAKSADERYASMEELANDVQAALATAPDAPAASGDTAVPGTVTHHGYAEEVAAGQAAPRLLAPTPATEFPAVTQVTARSGGAGLYIGLFAAVVLAGAGVAYLLVGRDKGDSSDAPKTVAAAVAPEAPKPPPKPPVAEEPEKPPEPTPTVSPFVAVEITTKPAGASVSIEDAEVCSPTPCSFKTKRGERVTVAVARRGYRSVKQKLFPTDDENAYTIELSRRRSSSGRNNGSSDERGSRNPSGLKNPFDKRAY